MSFMLKIALALPLTLFAAVGHGSSASAPAPAEQNAAELVPDKLDCSVCDEVYSRCLDEGITVAGCKRMTANCYKNCLLP